MATPFGPYPFLVDHVHDGDTIMGILDLGFGVHLHDIACRVYRIDSPELKVPEGKVARDFAQQLIRPGEVYNVVSYGWDKYGGRFDGMLELHDGRDFGAVMLNAGHAVPRPA